ncbi:hypothetical protein [Lacticaseibacillus paracasei]|uniref:hypothetical protein n=1 Tax=Lacticaseibacillus paracasei TaxID=1597 RepID=UPI0025A07B19|nr:hypothetical protein [Lacticaseibacillus paracasei]MDM7532960.1 hypothetical protein [Lacticaseibacillus paracasei]
MNLEKTLTSYLQEKGPSSSHEIIQMLATRLDKRTDYVRVSLHRFLKSNKKIHVSHVTIKHNEHFLYVDDQTVNLAELLIKKYAWSPVGRLLKELSTSAFLFSTELLKILGQPLGSSKGHKSAESYLLELEKDQIIEVKNADRANEYICFSKKLNGFFGIDVGAEKLETRRQLLTFQEAIISDFLDRWKKMNILAWNCTKQNHIGQELEDTFEIGGCYVDAFGLCYVSGIAKETTTKKKPNHIVINSLIYRNITKQDIDGFENALKIIKYKHKGNVIPVFIYGNPLPKDVFIHAKRSGMILISATTLFGNQLRTMLAIIKNIKKSNIADLNRVLDKFVGDSNNIKAYLFNVAIATLLMEMGYKDIRMNQKYCSNTGKKRECDIVVKNELEHYLIAFELKAYTTSRIKLGATEDEKNSVKKFFLSTTKAISDSEGKQLSIVPVFISMSGFEDDALEYMDKCEEKNASKVMKSLEITFPRKIHYDKSELLKASVSSGKHKWFKDMINQFF